MNKKLHILTVHEDYQFLLVGISSHENDYRISWAINNELGTGFIRTTNHKIHNKRTGEDQEFSSYHYFDQESLLHYNLFSNRCDNGFLLEEMTNIDFLLKITGDTDSKFLNQLINRLKKIDIITTAFAINPETLKSRKKLLL